LIISTNEEIKKGSSNISGVDVVSPKKLNIDHLAPGGMSGRLTVITQSALTVLGGKN